MGKRNYRNIIYWLSTILTILSASVTLWYFCSTFGDRQKEIDNIREITELCNSVDSIGVKLEKATKIHSSSFGRAPDLNINTDSTDIFIKRKSIYKLKNELKVEVSRLMNRWNNFKKMIGTDINKQDPHIIVEKSKFIISYKNDLDQNAIEVIRLMNSLDSVNIERIKDVSSYDVFAASDLYQTCIEYLNSSKTEQIAYSLNQLNSTDKKEIKSVLSSIDDMKNDVNMYRFYDSLLSECEKYLNYWNKKIKQ